MEQKEYEDGRVRVMALGTYERARPPASHSQPLD